MKNEKLEVARQKIESAKRKVEARKLLDKITSPQMVELAEQAGNPEIDSASDLDSLHQGFRNRAKTENARFALTTDSEYWACICFQTREQKEHFLAALKILEFGDKYLDGLLVAKRLGVILPESQVAYRTDPKLNKDWLSFVKE